MKIAFPLIDKHAWRGGYNYLLNLFSAIDMAAGTDVQPVLFVGRDVAHADLVPFQSLEKTTIVTSTVFNRKARLRRQFAALATGRDVQAERLFLQHEIRVVFENAWYYGRRFKLPVIAWLPDFQHRHLPQMFSRFGYWRRELGFRKQVSAGRYVLLSSRDALNDLRAFYPVCRAAPYVAPFAVEIDRGYLTANPHDVRRRYGLPAHFFFLPNQFYQHKNHTLVLSALKLLKDRGIETVIAASGNPRDPRGTQVISQLKQNIRDDRLDSHFIFLGSIAYADVIGLMRCSAALLNPSLFEGWSTTVEEAKALGVPMVLSDLSVHREQADGFASFFQRRSPESLAEILATHPVRGDGLNATETQALEAARQRRGAFAHKFNTIVHKCCQCAQQGSTVR